MAASPPPVVSETRRNSAIAWIIGGVAILGLGTIFVVLVAILLTEFQQVRIATVRTECISNLKNVAVGLLTYAADYDEVLPQNQWMDAIVRTRGMDEFMLHCPAVVSKTASGYGYALNSVLSGKRVAELDSASTLPLAFDSTNLAKNAVASAGSLPLPPRHGSKNVIAYLDGSVKAVPKR